MYFFLLFLQLTGSVALFYNKLYLQRHRKEEKQIGWILGIIGIVLISPAIYSKHFYIALVFHGGLVALALYGYLLLTDPRLFRKHKKVRLLLRPTITFATTGICVYLFTQIGNPNFGGWQLGQACTGLFGSLFLATNTKRSNILGWIFYILSHIFCIYYLSAAAAMELYIIILFQIFSLFVAIKAVQKLVRPRKIKT